MVAIGIDIGGTKIAIAAVGSQGEVLASVRFATEPNLGFKTALSKMISGINHVISDGVLKGEMLDGIGIGCAGPVDPARGTIHNPHTLPTWDDCDLVSPLAERTQLLRDGSCVSLRLIMVCFFNVCDEFENRSILHRSLADVAGCAWRKSWDETHNAIPA